MTTSILARRVLLPLGLAALLSTPAHAQAAGGTTGGSTGGSTGGGTSSMTDTTYRQPQQNKGFPWGLLGLLGLAGLLKRPQRETVVHRDTTTARPGDPNYRV